MRNVLRWAVLLTLTVLAFGCSLPSLNRTDLPQFNALQTAALQTITAQQTQSRLSSAAGTAAAQAINATDQSLQAQTTPAGGTLAPAASQPPTGASGTAPAATLPLATIQVTSEPASGPTAQPTDTGVLGTLTAGQAPPTAPAPTSAPSLANPTTQNPLLGRFQFLVGATSAATGGHLPGNAVIDYVVAGQAGQTMLVNVYSPNHDVHLGVTGVSDGAPLQPTAAGSATFTGVLPSTQDYRLTLAAPPQGSPFNVQVIIPARIEIPAGGVSTRIDGQVAGGESNYYLAKASGGQTMTVTIVSPRKDVFLIIYGMTDGLLLVRAPMGLSTWTGALPSDQDYMIQAVSTGQFTAYTLEVTIR